MIFLGLMLSSVHVHAQDNNFDKYESHCDTILSLSMLDINAIELVSVDNFISKVPCSCNPILLHSTKKQKCLIYKFKIDSVMKKQYPVRVAKLDSSYLAKYNFHEFLVIIPNRLKHLPTLDTGAKYWSYLGESKFTNIFSLYQLRDYESNKSLKLTEEIYQYYISGYTVIKPIKFKSVGDRIIAGNVTQLKTVKKVSYYKGFEDCPCKFKKNVVKKLEVLNKMYDKYRFF